MCHCLLELVVIFILCVARAMDLHSSRNSSVLQTIFNELHDSLRLDISFSCTILRHKSPYTHKILVNFQ